MSIVSLLPIILIGGMLFLMMRSSKNKQNQTRQMQNKLEPGVGIRTIGGMYALVKEVRDDAVELEVAPGVHALYAKNAIATVMDGVEYNRIVHGDDPDDELAPVYDAEEDDDAVEDGADETAAELDDAVGTPVLLGKSDTVVNAAADAAADASSDADKGAGDKAVSSK